MQPVRLFIASSSDVADECAIVESVAARLNETLGRDRGFVIQPFRYNRHAPPGISKTPGRVQDLLNPHLDEAAIVVMIVWNRVGDGVLEEYERALAAFRAKGAPRLMPYRCRRPIDFGDDEDAATAKIKAMKFIKRLHADGALPVEFSPASEFEQRVHDDLHKVLGELIPRPSTPLIAQPSRSASSPVAPALTETGREAYLAWVQERWGKLTLTGLLTDKVAPAVAVNDVYVSPLATRPGLQPPADADRNALPEAIGTLITTLSEAPLAPDGALPFALAEALRDALIALGVPPDHAAHAGGLHRTHDRLRALDSAPEPAAVERVLRTVDMDDAVRAGTHLLVEGAPGSGKTTVLKHIAVSISKAHAGEPEQAAALGFDAESGPFPIPAFVELRRFAQWLRADRPRDLDGDGRHLADFLAKTLQPPSGEDGWVHPALTAGTMLLLLDGLDEIPDATLCEECAAIVGSFVRHYPTCRYILTSRPTALSERVRQSLGRLTHCTILPLDKAHMSAFLNAWYGALLGDPVAASERAGALLQRLVDRPRLYSLADTPILLTAIAIVHKTLGDLPERRAELFEHCVKAMLHRWDASRDLESERQLCGPLDLDTKLAIVEEIAWRIHTGGADSRSLELDPLLALIAPLLPCQDDGGPLGKVAAGQLIEAMADRSGLLIPATQGGYEFAHLAFQEFLTARRACDRSLDPIGDLALHMHESWWREVIALAPAFKAINGKADAAAMLRALSERAQRLDGAPKGAALAAVALSLTDVRELPIPGLAQLIADTSKPLAQLVRDPAATVELNDRVLIGESLGWLGDPRLNDAARWVAIPEGPYWLGAAPGDTDALKSESPSGPREGSEPLYIQRWPVTRAEFKAFIDAGGYQLRELWDSEGWERHQHPEFSIPEGWAWQLAHAPNHPIVGVSWWEATPYCRWVNRTRVHGVPTNCVVRLPTDAEWERAARGPLVAGVDAAIWPWGRTWRDAVANTSELKLARPTPVGIFPVAEWPDGPWDTTGNVCEWCLDWFDPWARYRIPLPAWIERADGLDSYDVYSMDERTFIKGHGRVLRGGGWAFVARYARVSYRFGDAPAVRSGALGFRCAASPVDLGFGPRP